MAIDDICRRGVEVAQMHDTIQEAAAKMQHGVGMLVVVNQEHVPIGLVTDRDLVVRALAKEIDPARIFA